MLLKGITTIGDTTPLPPPLPVFTPMLDAYTGSVKAAYSLRKVSSAASYAIRVRRSTDNAEQDIGFVNEHLDTASLLSFAGSGDAYVSVLYDQSGNGIHMLQTASASWQKKIVNAGALIMANSRPMGLFDGVNDYYACAAGNEAYFTFMHDGTLYSIYAITQFGFTAEAEMACTVIANTAAASSGRGISIRYDDRTVQTRNQALQLTLGNGSSSVAAYLAQNNTGIAGAIAQITFHFDPSNTTTANRAGYRVNSNTINTGTTGGAVLSTAAQVAATRIGTITTGSNAMNGYLPELIILAGDQSANRTAIESNQKTYFNIS
ncbi:MAG: hypothetical protein EOP56_08285 [Sphingobacteriales bacterium]|nr:MAG: hypothetical protein EOP56_08285 [Sphingobacteriales bacterium]